MTLQDMSANPYRRHNINFVLISYRCGIVSSILLFTPLLIIIPVVSLTGLLSGIVGLFLSYRHGIDREIVKQAWAGCVLCAVSLVIAWFVSLLVLNHRQLRICTNNHRAIAESILQYSQEHDGNFPSSTHVINNILTPERRYCKGSWLNFFASRRQYLFNNNLAEIDMSSIRYPERTILTAEGEAGDIRVFTAINELYFTSVKSVVFCDGEYKLVSMEEIIDRLPEDGIITSDTWLIEPLFK